MALMVPDSLPSGANQGEKSLYEILQCKLPNDFYVWYEPMAQGCLPYFTILAPEFGLLIIKVANWFPRQIVSANSHNFQINSQKEETERAVVQQSSVEQQGRRTRKRSTAGIEVQQSLLQQSPLQESENYLQSLLDKLKAYPILTQPDGEYQCQLAFPVGCGAVMSNMTADQACETNIYKLLNKPQVAYREELLSWHGLCETELVNRLERMFIDRVNFIPLSPDQIDTIKGILHPEIVIKEVPASPHSIPDSVKLTRGSYVIQTLDHRQECIAKAIGEGHRIIYGIAGSGKTLILLCRAKLLANQNYNQRILILCYNRSLASHLKSILHEDLQNPQFKKQTMVFYFHAWVNDLMNKMPSPLGLTMDYYDELIGELLLEKLRKLPIELKWDAVLVDEAQTFRFSWFKCCVAALKDPENGNLMIVSDGNQGIYKRQGFTWKSVGIKAVGRTRSKKFNLDINYRNTQEILEAAWSVVNHIPAEQKSRITDDFDDSGVTFPIIKPASAIRHGSRPVMHLKITENQEIEAVTLQIKKLCGLGYDPRDIAVLYRIAADHKRQLLENLKNKLQGIGLDTYWVTESRGSEKRYSIKSPGIRLITALNSLGLEFKVVLILWVQDWDFNIRAISETDALTCRRLYVAMTRAQDVLHVFGSGNSPLLQELKHSGTFDIELE
ncbi:MAG TPA: 3'-5' exonuclease [Phormidium sp.]